MGLDSSLINDSTFPQEPFARGFKAKLFFSLVRKNEIKKVRAILRRDPFIIYEFDHIKQTALHHAAKRDFTEMTKLLCKNKAYVDKPDILGRTPLQLAVKYDYLRTVKALLAHKAKPGKCNLQGEDSISLCKNLQIKGFLQKGYLLSITLPLVPVHKRDAVWEKEGLRYFDNDNDKMVIYDFL